MRLAECWRRPRSPSRRSRHRAGTKAPLTSAQRSSGATKRAQARFARSIALSCRVLAKRYRSLVLRRNALVGAARAGYDESMKIGIIGAGNIGGALAQK